MLRDKEIREPLFDFLEERYGKCRILQEKIMGKSRADIVMVTEGALYGIEIKSDADRYLRLKTQVPDYERYFDYNILAVGSSHALHAAEHVPESWGILSIEESGEGLDFYELRAAGENKKRSLKRQLSLLFRPELSRILKRNALPEYSSLSKAALIRRLTELLPSEILSDELTEELFERDYLKIEEEILAWKRERGRLGALSTGTGVRRTRRREAKLYVSHRIRGRRKR